MGLCLGTKDINDLVEERDIMTSSMFPYKGINFTV